jgi:Bacterial Ig-like domain (group 2)
MTGLQRAISGGIMLLAACGSEAPGPNPEPTGVCAVRVSAPEEGTQITIEAERSLNATAEMCDPNDAPPEVVTWSSSDAAVASVSADGVVTGEGKGEARITATIGGVSGSLEVQVDLPAAGQAAYTIAYVGGSFDTTYRNTGRAILCSDAYVYLNTDPNQGDKSGFIALGTVDAQPFALRGYPLRGDAAEEQPGTATAYTIFNGYSADITGHLSMLTVGPAEIGGAFDFSAPTVDQSPNFTVRIRGSFLASPDDPTLICH